MSNEPLAPFLKWPGGKRWLLKKYPELFSIKFNKYYEPFLGSGAIFFHLCPKESVLSDVNDELINLYIQMRDYPQLLIEQLKIHQKLHSKTYYYEIRDKVYISPIEKAGRFLYLNRTCFNGMYRENKNGKFNVPIGTKDNCVYDINNFKLYSNALKQSKLIASDFRETIKMAGSGDLLFVDPPYTMGQSQQNGFIKYNSKLFSWTDQKDLCNEIIAARARGVIIISTNAYCDEISDMYKKEGFCVKAIEKISTISGIIEKRKKTTELLITSFPAIHQQVKEINCENCID